MPIFLAPLVPIIGGTLARVGLTQGLKFGGKKAASTLAKKSAQKTGEKATQKAGETAAKKTGETAAKSAPKESATKVNKLDAAANVGEVGVTAGSAAKPSLLETRTTGGAADSFSGPSAFSSFSGRDLPPPPSRASVFDQLPPSPFGIPSQARM